MNPTSAPIACMMHGMTKTRIIMQHGTHITMNRDIYQLWPIHIRHNVYCIGAGRGKTYFRIGMGPRWESGWTGKQDMPGSRRMLGWALFVGPFRIIFGNINYQSKARG
jgi:hypothetical protein